jgi:hypothetical protein
MKRLALAFAALLLASSARADGIGPTFDNFGGGISPPRSVAAVLPGNLISGASAWWGLRAYDAAHAGTKAIRIVRASDSVQSDINSLANGNLDVATATTFCNATTCTIVTMYDQSGALACTGAVACDVTNATVANQPALTFNCIGSRPCATYLATQSAGLLTAVTMTAPIQPFTIAAVAERTGSFTSNNAWIGQVGVNGFPMAGFDAAVNQLFMYDGLVVSVAGVADSTFHAVQNLFNAASSSFFVDGTLTPTTSPGLTTWVGLQAQIGVQGGGGYPLNGKFTEVGIWPVAFTAPQQSSMNVNQHAYWGF